MERNRIQIERALILLQIRRGDPAGFEGLVRMWEKPLFYYVRRLIHREEDAWDVMQEVWLRAFGKIRALRDEAMLNAWLYSIARNCAITHLRKSHIIAGPWPPETEEGGPLPEPAAPEPAELPGGYTARDIHWALDQIPVAEREVLTLHFLEGFRLDEIASIADVPVGTVKSRMHRAKQQLRSVLEKEGR